MTNLKTLFFVVSIITCLSCLKSNVCECSTFDEEGEFLFLVSNEDQVENCDSSDTIITDSGDTNYVFCTIEKR
ncbi:MAG: hypothetical protein ABF242_02810 [Flavobacteriales bacterium]